MHQPSRTDDRYLLQRNALVALTSGNALNSDDLQTSFGRITEVAAHTLGVARVSVWRYNVDRSEIRCADLFDQATGRHSSGGQLSAESYPAYFHALTEMTVLAADDARHDPRTSEFAVGYLEPLGITSMMDVPIHLGGAVAGVLCHEHVGPVRQWTADECTFGVALGNLVSLALEGWERRRAEEWLRNSETRHRVLFEDSADANMVMNASGFLNCNTAALQMFGYGSSDEFALLHQADVSPLCQPDGTPSLAAAEGHIAAAFVNGKRRFEWMYQRKSGEVFPAEVCLTAVTLSGQPMLLATVRDLTERARAEADLRLQSAALDAAGNAIAITGRDGTIAWVNKAFTTLTGYSRSEAVGATPRNLLRSGSQDVEFYKRLWETVLAGKVWHGEMVNRRKDGAMYPEDMVITPVENVRGKVTHFIAIKRDLTEERRLEAQLLQSQKMEVVGRLAGGIAHDFNNLLTVINGTAELALGQVKAGDPVGEDLKEIRRAGARAAALTQQLLAFSRKQVATPQILSLPVLVGGLGSMLQRVLGENIRLVASGQTGGACVKADPGQIEQVILNLAVNARDAMPAGGTLSIEILEQDAPAPRHVLLTLRDTGTGMDEATLSRVFEPFFTTKEPGKGTGLGLATAHGIVRQSGGTIEITSEVGHGTTCLIRLPLAAGEPRSERLAPVAAPASAAETVLVVEDEPAVRRMATRMLESSGYTVLTASNGAEALVLLERHEGHVDLLLSDVIMPVMSGPELASRIGGLRPRMRVLFTSGHTDNELLRRDVFEEAAHFVAKPYTKDDLLRSVRAVLDGPA